MTQQKTPEQYREELAQMDREQLHQTFCDTVGDSLREFFNMWYTKGKDVIVEYLVDTYEVAQWKESQKCGV